MMSRFLLGTGGLVFAFTALTVVAPTAEAAPCEAANIRWASSSNNVYVMGAGTVCTLTEIDVIADKANLELVDPGTKTWFVGSNIIVQQGATLNLHGSESGGDVDELRLRSDSAVAFLRAYWGTIDIKDTKIQSWTGSGPDTDSGSLRPYIQVKSFLEGDTPRESTMNISNSDISYLGYYAAESYGLSWKVLGTGAGLYDKVGVKGTVTSNHIHHNYFGAYTWGADAMVWTDNEFANNRQYGLDPHDNSDNLNIENNLFHHNGNHGMICSRFCDHLTIRGNTSYNNTGNGFMLHRLANDSLFENNEAYNNTDSGIAIFDSHSNTIRNNNSHDNKNGMRFSVGSSNNLIQDNIIDDSSSYGMYFFKGSDAPTEVGDGRPKNNRFINNTITDSSIYGIKLREADNNLFQDNDFINNGKTLLLEAATGNRFLNNLISDNDDVGITLSGATNHELSGNTIERNTNTGVHLKSGSTGAKITNNIIRNHTKYGILVTSGTGPTISGNTFSNNGKNIGP